MLPNPVCFTQTDNTKPSYFHWENWYHKLIHFQTNYSCYLTNYLLPKKRTHCTKIFLDHNRIHQVFLLCCLQTSLSIIFLCFSTVLLLLWQYLFSTTMSVHNSCDKIMSDQRAALQVMSLSEHITNDAAVNAIMVAAIITVAV